jgi:soluble lytic murein transglycosylase
VNRPRPHALLLAAVLVLALAAPLAWWRYWSWRDHRYDPLIRAAASRHQVDPAVVKAVIWRESRFDPSARGRAGERGLMQIREPAARDWVQAEKVAGFDPGHLLDPTTNTLAGTWYLGHLLKRYRQTDNPLPYALADYNAGRTRVLQWMQEGARTNHAEFLHRIDFPGTRRYIEAILAKHPAYRADF